MEDFILSHWKDIMLILFVAERAAKVLTPNWTWDDKVVAFFKDLMAGKK